MHNSESTKLKKDCLLGRKVSSKTFYFIILLNYTSLRNRKKQHLNEVITLMALVYYFYYLRTDKVITIYFIILVISTYITISTILC